MTQSALSPVPPFHEFALHMKLTMTVRCTVDSSAGASMLLTADAVRGDDPGGKDTTEGSCEGWTDEYGASYAS